MLAAQVNACKDDQLRIIMRIIFGFVWIWGIGLCGALLGWLLIAAAECSRWPFIRAVLDRRHVRRPPPPFACWLELWVPLALCSVRSLVGSSLHCIRVLCFWWASEQDVRVSRGRFRDLSLRLWSMFAHLCIALCSVVGCCTWHAGMRVSCLSRWDPAGEIARRTSISRFGASVRS